MASSLRAQNGCFTGLMLRCTLYSSSQSIIYSIENGQTLLEHLRHGNDFPRVITIFHRKMVFALSIAQVLGLSLHIFFSSHVVTMRYSQGTFDGGTRTLTSNVHC